MEIAVEYPRGARRVKVLNFCANNYLGLSSHPEVIKAAHKGLDERGYGMSSVRFICGTQDVHNELERRWRSSWARRTAILFGRCFDANAAVFEVLLDEEDVIISDRLDPRQPDRRHPPAAARSATATRTPTRTIWRRSCSSGTPKARNVMVVTDGVFSMDGILAPLDKICALAEASTARWCWWTTATPRASSARPGAACTSTSA